MSEKPVFFDLAESIKWNKLIDASAELKEQVSKLQSSAPFARAENPTFRFIDLFAGIGGFRLALQSLGGESVFSSEWDSAAKQTYWTNYGEVPFGDLRQFTAEMHRDDRRLDDLIPDHDVLAAGFPCQPFSRAGVSARTSLGIEHGFACKTQGTLFFEVLEIVRVKQPKVVFLENVKNLRSHDGGMTFDTIKGSLEELGYSFSAEVVNASSLVPQRRERCYMVCLRDDVVPFKFPMESFRGVPRALKEILDSEPDPSLTISDKLWLGHQSRTTRNLSRGAGFTAFAADVNKPAHTLVARYGKDGKECLVPTSNGNPRMLSPRECARLQGFPEAFVLPSSRTPAYKQFGNSVAVPVVRRIAEEFMPHLISRIEP
jgi:DNA (cytosine-5)-methyltransferase 1